ncbi:MAG TPA: GNAT family N-acetyltransferase [Anaerolineales bacterium]|nr:GNAT family N-acetyltransferase [Anaerolineales bacterium]
MNIRYATLADAHILAELGAKTFQDTFSTDNTPENMDAYLKASFSPEIQLRELSEPDVIFLIAESEGIPVAYAQLLMKSMDESIKGARPLEVRRIYASQEYRGKGVGKALMRAIIEEARQRGCDCVWLGVWEKNQRAIDFYKKWGFRVVGSHTFALGEDPQNDFVMELALT